MPLTMGDFDRMLAVMAFYAPKSTNKTAPVRRAVKFVKKNLTAENVDEPVEVVAEQVGTDITYRDLEFMYDVFSGIRSDIAGFESSLFETVRNSARELGLDATIDTNPYAPETITDEEFYEIQKARARGEPTFTTDELRAFLGIR